MRGACLILSTALVAIVAWTGCGGGEREITPAGAGEPAVERPAGELPGISPTTDPKLRPKFIPAVKARRSPVLELTDLDGETRKVQPGRSDYVTLLVFWSVDLPAGPAAAEHVRDLAHKYSALGVRAVGVVERTSNYLLAAEFLRARAIDYPVHWDDFSALDDMGEAAGVSAGKSVPCFFLIDRRLRVRMFKRGFAYWLTSRQSEEQEWTDRTLVESAPEGERLEDLIGRLLEED